jgi:hypothetical protein
MSNVVVIGVEDSSAISRSSVSACTTAEPSKPAENRIYVQPRWVDGGYEVGILEPGYWTVSKQAPEH